MNKLLPTYLFTCVLAHFCNFFFAKNSIAGQDDNVVKEKRSRKPNQRHFKQRIDFSGII